MRLAAGHVLGHYEIVAFIGEGGMGEVYRAKDLRLRREVAVKVLQTANVDPEAWTRFEREAHSASALNHPNICTIHDLGEADGQPYLVMELIDGVSLRSSIGSGGLDTAAMLPIAIQIADALEAAHSKHIVHRDIKPGNVMITSRGHAKVLDFGLAKLVPAAKTGHTATLEPLTAAGKLVGTSEFLAPEILQGGQTDERSDVWAFGVTLYQMATGRLPFTGATPFEVSSTADWATLPRPSSGWRKPCATAMSARASSVAAPRSRRSQRSRLRPHRRVGRSPPSDPLDYTAFSNAAVLFVASQVRSLSLFPKWP